MNKKRGHKKDISLNVYTLLSIEKAHDNLKLWDNNLAFDSLINACVIMVKEGGNIYILYHISNIKLSFLAFSFSLHVFIDLFKENNVNVHI